MVTASSQVYSPRPTENRTSGFRLDHRPPAPGCAVFLIEAPFRGVGDISGMVDKHFGDNLGALLFPQNQPTKSSRSGGQYYTPSDANGTDVILLSKRLGSVGDFGSGRCSAKQFLHAIEPKEISLGVHGLGNAVRE